jgi:ferredoxin
MGHHQDSKDSIVRLENPADQSLGCGACISSCPTGSLPLVAVVRPQPPERKRQLFQQILKEKKRLMPFVVERAKTSVLRRLERG